MAESPASDSSILDTILKWGGALGIGGIAVAVFKRWARERPQADLAAKKFGASSYRYIRVNNPGTSPILISQVQVCPPIYFITKSHSEKDIGAAMDGGDDVNALLGPGATHDLLIINRWKNASQPVLFRICWHKTNSRRWQLPVTISTSTQVIDRIADATAEKFIG